MKTLRLSRILIAACLCVTCLSAQTPAPNWQYFRVGNTKDLQTKPKAGTAMLGGGEDLDEAFRWLCDKANGGDFLVLRATGEDAYNPYINQLCKLNSAATIIIPDRASAQDLGAVEIIKKAEVLFISGGDQANYIRNWQGTPVQDAINAHVAAGKPIGGTSAGLAVEGEFAYGALGDKPEEEGLASVLALSNPYEEHVTLVRGFLKIPHLENLLTDSHLAKRDRMGRTLVFLARIIEDGWSNSPHEIAIDERSGVLVEPDGQAKIIGAGKGAYFLRPSRKPDVCKKDQPLTFRNISVYRVLAGGRFDLPHWKGTGGTAYSLSVENGKVTSAQANKSVY
jgi:cyanophycinase-like exopeptidase